MSTTSDSSAGEPVCVAGSPAAKAGADDVSDRFRYTHAIVRSHHPLFATDSLRFEEPDPPINQERAEQQHAAYVKALRKVVPDVVELPPLSGHPDCVFVEDTAVIVGTTALITAIGTPSRRGEVESIARTLSTIADGRMRVVRAEELVPGAAVDGGDVLYTGHHIFVGQSTRSNAKGVEALRAAFPGVPVHPIRVRGALHLKSLLSLAAPGVLVASGCEAGREAVAAINAAAASCSRAPTQYEVRYAPNAAAANVVYGSGWVLHRPDSEHPGASKVLDQLRREGKLAGCTAVAGSEGEKADGALTCCSLLINANYDPTA